MISVIIPTFNRATLLEITLRSIAQQTLPFSAYEIIVIDNASTDNTKAITLSLANEIPNIRYIYEPAPGLHSGRHRGMKEAKGDILVYADDDIEPLPEWLASIQECFRDPQVAIVGGKNIPNYESPPPAWLDELWEQTPQGKYITYFSLLDFGDNVKEIHPMFVFGCNFSVRKKVLEEIKGFHPDGMPGNLLKFRGDGETHVAESVHAAGYKTIYHPKASVKHWVPASRMNQDYIRKRAYSEGITYSYSFTRKHPDGNQGASSIKSFFRKIKSRFDNLFLSKLRKEILKATSEGYAYHQAEMKKDETLRQWVLKENYLD
jgi:glycosyltransferase involved in cell wall biosynthesis